MILAEWFPEGRVVLAAVGIVLIGVGLLLVGI